MKEARLKRLKEERVYRLKEAGAGGTGTLATNAELAAYFADEAAGLDGLQACLRLTWAVLLSNQGPPTSRGRPSSLTSLLLFSDFSSGYREGPP